MSKQNVSINTLFFTYFGFGAVAGVLFALLVMAVSNVYITHHDEPMTISYSSYKK